MTVETESYVTLVATNSYAVGAVVLGHSLRESGTERRLTVLVTDRVSEEIRNKLSQVYDLVVKVDELNSQDTVNLALLCRPELGITFTKLFAWKLTQFQKCVFLDADTLVLQNMDDCFEREELSAAPDVGWPDCFNSGVFVFVPSLDTFSKLVEFASSTGSFDGGDQGLLNQYFSDWATADIKKHLPFGYNLNANATYFYAPAYKHYEGSVKLVHFIGPAKPWRWARDGAGCVLASEDAPFLVKHVQLWWDILTRYMSNKEAREVYHTPEVSDRPASFQTPFSTRWEQGVAQHSYGQQQHLHHHEQPQETGFAAIQKRLDSLILDSPHHYNYPTYQPQEAVPETATEPLDTIVQSVAQQLNKLADSSEEEQQVMKSVRIKLASAHDELSSVKK